jgi:signal transduction histidine kinase
VTSWLTAHSADIVLLAFAVSLGLLAIVIILLTGWRAARRRGDRADSERAGAERARLDAEMALAEQTNRLRIIRELHEVAAHSLSVVISQADGARYAAQRDPSAVGRSASVIAETTRSTLADLRRVMRLVGEGESTESEGARLDAAHELIDIMRDQGLDIILEESGDAFPLTPGAEIAVYRILQQALTSALGSGGPGTEARVFLSWSEHGVQLRVDDDGIRARARGTGETQSPNVTTPEADLAALVSPVEGRGIDEMRARAELYGGILSVTTQAGVGVSVSVVFPSLRHHNGIHGVDLRRT